MLVVDKEFQSLIPPLSEEEYAGLEQSILGEGCRDAIVIWRATGVANGDQEETDPPMLKSDPIIVDGHNRYEICTKHDIPFKTTELDAYNRDEVMQWIILNQFGRRNLSAYDRSLLALKLKPMIAEKAKEQQVRKSVSQKSVEQKPIDTQKELAKVAGVSHDTIHKVETIEKKATPEVKEQLRSGEMSISQAYKTVKSEEKKQEIEQAHATIEAEKEDKPSAPTLIVGDGIGHTPDEPYDLLLTDPPYSTDVADIEAFVKSWLYNALDHVKPTGFAYVFIGAYPKELRAYLNADIPKHMCLTQQLIWTYKNTLGNNPKDRYKQNYQVCLFYRGVNAPALDCPLTSEQWAVQEINAPDGRQGDRYHTWQKPMEIAERFVRHSTKKGMTVFDPFACTGTFLLAGSKLGRAAYGFEIDPDNAAIAFKRGCVNGAEL